MSLSTVLSSDVVRILCIVLPASGGALFLALLTRLGIEYYRGNAHES